MSHKTILVYGGFGYEENPTPQSDPIEVTTQRNWL